MHVYLFFAIDAKQRCVFVYKTAESAE